MSFELGHAVADVDEGGLEFLVLLSRLAHLHAAPTHPALELLHLEVAKNLGGLVESWRIWMKFEWFGGFGGKLWMSWIVGCWMVGCWIVGMLDIGVLDSGNVGYWGVG